MEAIFKSWGEETLSCFKAIFIYLSWKTCHKKCPFLYCYLIQVTKKSTDNHACVCVSVREGVCVWVDELLCSWEGVWQQVVHWLNQSDLIVSFYSVMSVLSLRVCVCVPVNVRCVTMIL